MVDDIGERRLIELAERRLHVAQLELQVPAEGIVHCWIADSLGGRPQLVGQGPARMPAGLKSVAELGGQPHDGRGPRSRSFGQVGHRSERDELRVG